MDNGTCKSKHRQPMMPQPASRPRKEHIDKHHRRRENGVVLPHFPVSIPLSPNPLKRKLVLHFDVRNTVLVADSVTNVSVEQALNAFLTGVTWGRDRGKSWEWLSDEPSLTSPCVDAITYYKHLEKQLVGNEPSDRVGLRKATGFFTQEQIGKKFEGVFKKSLKYLEWHHGQDHKPCLTMHGQEDGTLYHYIVPAFFKLINHLYEHGRDFAIIIRTYGMDAPTVLLSTEVTMNGEHPQFPTQLPLPVYSPPGHIRRVAGRGIVVETPAELYSPSNIQNGSANGKQDAVHSLTNERDIYEYFNRCSGVCGYVDDFMIWSQAGYHHTSGKPLWIDLSQQDFQHIFFDDNIRVTDSDSIVDLRLFPSKFDTEAKSVTLDQMPQFEDVCLVQADLLNIVKNVDYFIDKVETCERNYTKLLESFNKGSMMSCEILSGRV